MTSFNTWALRAWAILLPWILRVLSPLSLHALLGRSHLLLFHMSSQNYSLALQTFVQSQVELSSWMSQTHLSLNRSKLVSPLIEINSACPWGCEESDRTEPPRSRCSSVSGFLLSDFRVAVLVLVTRWPCILLLSFFNRHSNFVKREK